MRWTLPVDLGTYGSLILAWKWINRKPGWSGSTTWWIGSIPWSMLGCWLYWSSGFFDDEFVLEQTINENLTGRACGHDIVFNINTSLLAQARGEEAFVSIDSLDTGIEYHIDYEDCHSTIIRSREERRIRAEQRQEFLQNNHRNEQRRRLSQERRLRESRNIQVRASERRTNTRTQRRETQAELRAQRANRNARTAQTNRRQVIRNR